MRGGLWFGLYVGLALAPLVLAASSRGIDPTRGFGLEFAVGFGFVAYALMALEFALVSRFHAASEPFGMDALLLFHKKMGLTALGFVGAHAIYFVLRGQDAALLDPFSGPLATRTGALALWAGVLLVLTSVARRRIRLSYGLWQLLHRVLAFLLMGAMLWHVLAVGHHASVPLVRACLIAYAGLFLALLLRYRLVDPLLTWRRPWAVAASRAEGGDTVTLVLRPLGHDGLSFEPGQFVWLGTGRTPFSAEQHPITIASSAVPAPDRAIELAIKALGDWSRTTVPALRAGARVWIDGPFGAFSLDRAAAQGFVLVAGGIGITPMRSMLLTMRDRGDRRPVLLIYAASHRGRAVFAAQLEALTRELALRVVFVFEAAPADWPGERGRITVELLRRHLPADLSRQYFFVCGPGPMMDQLERQLVELGVPPERVQTERFDMV